MGFEKPSVFEFKGGVEIQNICVSIKPGKNVFIKAVSALFKLE